MRDPEGNGFCIQSPRNDRSATSATSRSRAPSRVALGKFWRSALGWPDEEIDESFIQSLLDAGMDERRDDSLLRHARDADEPSAASLPAPREVRPASYPIHLDFRPNDREAEIERLQLARAHVEEEKSDDAHVDVMRDPESNPFCVE
jgi:hypothetical protein